MDTKLLQCLVAVCGHGEALALHRDVLGPEVCGRAFRDPAGDGPRFVRARTR
ncbi:hypothetical protein [Streptomyces sp. CNQ085]|uniref:hypothetical protein n=1 Tax=Streptomyces sp. CNQ085 TaxID=2886944 RepID=UPI001F5042CD|nr:hypothetical protein [Streptomyces sp. CNQ085]MCI0386784.1 hypothetical protein [Streptomyces sp. CNQ085]